MALQLDVELRAQVAGDLLAALRQASPGSTAEIGGSMAAGTADDFSDIDALWVVPADRFDGLCGRIGEILASVRPVSSVRFEGDAVGSTRRGVLARFDGLSLFWCLELEITSSAHRDAGPSAEGETTGSHTHSALMCAVAAVKALLRGQPEACAKLVSKGFERIHIPVPAVPPREQILALADTIYDADDSQAVLADEVRRLYHDAFG